MATEVTGQETYVGKLTTKALGCRPDMVKTLEDGKNKLALCRIYGHAAQVKKQNGTDQAGNPVVHTFFQGEFEGFNLQTGECLRSGKLFLPKGISEVVEQAIDVLHKKEGRGTDAIAFAFEIRSVKASNPIGYSYEAVAIRKPEQEDALAEMRKEIGEWKASDKVLALPAPQGGAKKLSA